MNFNDPRLSLYGWHDSFVMLFACAVYICILALICWYAYYRTHNSDDFLIGSRGFGKISSGLSAGASDMSAWLLLGLPGAVYSMGLAAAWIAIGLLFGQAANILVIAKKIRIYSEGFQAITIPDYLEKRVQDPTSIIKMTTTIAIVFFFSIYVASSFVASARIFELIFQLPYTYGLLIGLLIIVVQAMIGGYTATTLTDAFQALFISLSIAIVLAMTFYFISQEGAPTFNMFKESIAHDAGNMFSFLSAGTAGFIGLLSSLAWGLGYFGQPHILIRFKSMKNPNDALGVFYVCISWMLITLIFSILIGLFAYGYFIAHLDVADNPENSLLYLSMYSMGAFGTGLMVIAIFSASMSTANSQLIVVSGIFIRDVLKMITGNDIESLTVNRLIMFAIGIIAFLIAMRDNSTILGLVEYAWGGLGASIGSLVFMTSLSKDINWRGGIACVISGFIAVIVFNILRPYTGIYELLPAFVIAIFMCYFVSKITGGADLELQNKLIKFGEKHNIKV